MSVTSTEKKRRVIMFGLLGTALAVAIILAAFVVFTPEKPSSSARLVSARSESVTGQAGGEVGRIQSEAEGTRYATGQ